MPHFPISAVMVMRQNRMPSRFQFMLSQRRAGEKGTKSPVARAKRAASSKSVYFFIMKSLRRNKMSFYYNGNGTGGEWGMENGA